MTTTFEDPNEPNNKFDILKKFITDNNFKFSAIGMKLRNKQYKDIKEIFDDMTSMMNEDCSLSEKIWNILNPDSYPGIQNGCYPKYVNLEKGYDGFHNKGVYPYKKKKPEPESKDYSTLSQDEIDLLKESCKQSVKDILDNDPTKKKFTHQIRKNKELYDDIKHHIDFLPEESTFAEHIYLYVNDMDEKDIICKNGNRLKFLGYNHGYRFCGKTGVCACAAESVSNTIKNTLSNRTKEEQKEINKKRENTILEKSGGEYSNNAQSPEARQKHEEFYSNPENVKEQVEKQQNTMMEKYGVKAAFQLPEVVEKAKQDNIEKYGCENVNQRHIENSNLEILNDPESLNEIYQKEGSIKTAEILGVHSSHINRKIKEYGLDKNIVNSAEQELYSFLKEIGIINIKQNTRPLDGLEIDLLCEDQKFGIEYNGIYWHSDKFKDPSYHKDKTDKAISLGYNIIQIFEDEWKESKDIIKNIIKNKLGISDKEKINARDCTVKEVSSEDARKFIDEYHIQGFTGAKYHYGLYDKNNELVSIMSFRKNNKFKNSNIIELSRYASSSIVRGGASKIFKYFVDTHTEYDEIISYADKRWSNGDLYYKLGFSNCGDIPINYSYVFKKRRVNKENFRKEDLKKMFDLSDDDIKNKTENDITKEHGIYRIYDCGKIKFIWKRN